MDETRRDRLDQLLDVLTEEVSARLTTRRENEKQALSAESENCPTEDPRASTAAETSARPLVQESVDEPSDGVIEESEVDGKNLDVTVDSTSAEEPLPTPPAKGHAARLLGRMAIVLIALVAIINLPINRHGVTLATAMPDARALIVRNGLLVKESGNDAIYVYENGSFRWVSSLDAFEHYGFTWERVHIVEDGFLDDYEIGKPLHVVLKCTDSPHIYALENGVKRWIVDIEAFEAEGYAWDDVQFVACGTLRGTPDGETIPPGQGPPPEP